PDAKRIVVQMQRHTAAVIEFKIQVIRELEVEPGFVAVVARQASASRSYAGAVESATVRRRAAATALRCRAGTENAADHRLISPRRDVVRPPLQTEQPLIIFQAAIERRVVTEARERPREISCVQDAVAHSRIQERRPITKSTINMIRVVPHSVA